MSKEAWNESINRMSWKGCYKAGRDRPRLEEDDEQSFSRTGSGLALAILMEQEVVKW